MTNRDVARIFEEMAFMLDMQGVEFKPRAYEKAATAIELLQDDLRGIYEHGGLKALEEIPGVGTSLAAKIEEYLTTGHIHDYDILHKRFPIKIAELSSIEGLGPKTILKLYKELDIKTLAQLERAAKAGTLANVVGPKAQDSILRAIGFAKQSAGRQLIGFVLPDIEHILEELRTVPGVKRIELAGSARRMQETIGDVDILAISDDSERVMEAFTHLPEVVAIRNRGETKSSVRLELGIDADLEVVPPESFGAAWQYFTGDKYHNIKLREVAIEQGYKLNEYGLFKGTRRVAGETEEDIYEKLGFAWMPPELRTNNGELDAAAERKLPKLIGYDDLKGDLHTHTDWTDGEHTIAEMAQAAHDYGLEYLCITDHTKSLAMTHGSDEKRLRRQMAEIDEVQKKFKDIHILKGVEVDILKDGALDLSDDVLAELDVVCASVHSRFNLSEKEQTDRIVHAMENPHVDIIGHPTGRLIDRRAAYHLDMDAIIAAAQRTHTVLEVNTYPNRLDLKDEYIRTAIAGGVKLAIDTDAHATTHFPFLRYGIGQARRGWATKGDIINTRSWSEMLKLLK